LFSSSTKPCIYLHPAPSFFARYQHHCLYQKQKTTSLITITNKDISVRNFSLSLALSLSFSSHSSLDSACKATNCAVFSFGFGFWVGSEEEEAGKACCSGGVVRFSGSNGGEGGEYCGLQETKNSGYGGEKREAMEDLVLGWIFGFCLFIYFFSLYPEVIYLHTLPRGHFRKFFWSKNV
jgi:hypothetical protein